MLSKHGTGEQMYDYIKKQVTIDEINKALDRETLLNSFVRKIAVEAVKKMPSADVVEVVRCWNCVWWDNCPSSTITPNFHMCKRVGRMSMPSDGFCSFGERKDG